MCICFHVTPLSIYVSFPFFNHPSTVVVHHHISATHWLYPSLHFPSLAQPTNNHADHITAIAMNPARGDKRASSSSSRSTKLILRSVLALGLVLSCVTAVKREDFKTCAQSGFCTRNRAYADLAKESSNWASPYQLNPSTLRLSKGILSGDLINTQEDVQPSPRPGLAFELHLLDNDAVRVRINERDPIQPRYDGVQDTVLIKPYRMAQEDRYQRISKDDSGVLTVQYGTQNQNTIKVSSAPFKIEFLANGVPTVLLNEEGLLRFERLRTKQQEPEPESSDENKLVDQDGETKEGEIKIEKSALEQKLEENMWEEKFKEFTDSKPRGKFATLQRVFTSLASVERRF